MTNPDPTIAWQVVLTLGVLLVLAGQAYNFVQLRRKGGSDGTTSGHSKDCVSFKHCEMVEQRTRERLSAVEALVRTNSGRIDGLSSALGQQLNQLRLELKEDSERMHRRIDKILEAVSELKGESRHLHAASG